MIKRTVSLNAINKVKEFVNLTCQTELDVDLISGRYVIDAKSIMGIFSLNLAKPIDLHIHTEDESLAAEYLESIARFLVE